MGGRFRGLTESGESTHGENTTGEGTMVRMVRGGGVLGLSAFGGAKGRRQRRRQRQRQRQRCEKMTLEICRSGEQDLRGPFD